MSSHWLTVLATDSLAVLTMGALTGPPAIEGLAYSDFLNLYSYSSYMFSLDHKSSEQICGHYAYHSHGYEGQDEPMFLPPPVYLKGRTGWNPLYNQLAGCRWESGL